MYNTKHNTKTMGNKYVLGGYRILKQEIAKYNAFNIDERYFQLRRDLEICEQFLRETEPEMFKA